MSSWPLSTHYSTSSDPVLAFALCGATCKTTSTGSMRMTPDVPFVDCLVCRDLLGKDD